MIAKAARIAAQGRRVAVNLSGKSIDQRLLACIASELRAAGADPTNLIFELTETALLKGIKVVEEFARGLADLGCGLALDDFGTGFAPWRTSSSCRSTISRSMSSSSAILRRTTPTSIS